MGGSSGTGALMAHGFVWNIIKIYLIQRKFEQIKDTAKNEPSRKVNIASMNRITYPGIDNYSYSVSKVTVT